MTEIKIDIAVIGAMKSASTTVADFLRQHPDVFVPERKLLNYFSYGMAGVSLSESEQIEATASEQAVRFKEDYDRHFEGATSRQLLTDCSDSYYFFPGTARRMFDHNPDMKIVLVMREPVARAFSSFNHARSHMLESAGEFETVLSRSPEDESTLLPIRRYKTLGQYGRLIRPFVDCFGTAQVHLIGFEELVEDYDSTLEKLTQFLNIPEYTTERVWSNPTYVPPDWLAGKVANAIKKPARKVLRMSSSIPQFKKAILSIMRRIYKRPDPLNNALKEKFKREFADDIAHLEETFGPGFYSQWR